MPDPLPCSAAAADTSPQRRPTGHHMHTRFTTQTLGQYGDRCCVSTVLSCEGHPILHPLHFCTPSSIHTSLVALLYLGKHVLYMLSHTRARLNPTTLRHTSRAYILGCSRQANPEILQCSCGHVYPRIPIGHTCASSSMHSGQFRRYRRHPGTRREPRNTRATLVSRQCVTYNVMDSTGSSG